MSGRHVVCHCAIDYEQYVDVYVLILLLLLVVVVVGGFILRLLF